MSAFKVTVTQYGRPELNGVPYYAIAVYSEPEDPTAATIFQLCGTTKVEFEFNDPVVLRPRQSATFKGELAVGRLPARKSSLEHFNLHWTAEVLCMSSKLGLDIDAYGHAALAAAMEKFAA